MRLPLVAALLPCVALAAPVAAAPAPPVTWGELIAPDRVLGSLAHSLMGALRTVTYLAYEDIALDLRAGAVTLSEATLRPFPEAHPMAGCTIRMDRLRLEGVPLEVVDRVALDMIAEGIDVSLDCLPRDILPFAAAAGVDGLRADVLSLGLSYHQPSSALVATLEADLPGLIGATARAEFDYVWMQVPAGYEDAPLPLADLSRAEISLFDQGAWAIASRMLPPEALSPDALAFGASQMVTGALEDWSVGPDGTPEPLSGAQRRFIQEVAGVMRRLPDGPRELVLTLTPDPAPLRLSQVALDTASPAQLFEALNPSLRLGLVDSVTLLPADLLQTAFDAPQTLSPTARRSVGLAMLRGVGAPYAPGPGLDLLEPLLDDDDGTLHLAMAEALVEMDPTEAYVLALTAAERRTPGALSLLDTIERQIGLADAIALQPLPPEAPGDRISRTAFARQARAAMIGQGQPRSYVSAAYWAGLAAAAGDPSAARLRERLDAMMARSGHDGWQEQVTDVDDRVLDDWIVHDIPARLAPE